MGSTIAKYPWKTISICWAAVLISSLGLFNFYHEKNPVKLWSPTNSRFALDTDWLLKTFKQGYRPQMMIIKADDVLQPKVLQYMNAIHKKIIAIYTDQGDTWEDICFK